MSPPEKPSHPDPSTELQAALDEVRDELTALAAKVELLAGQLSMLLGLRHKVWQQALSVLSSVVEHIGAVARNLSDPKSIPWLAGATAILAILATGTAYVVTWGDISISPVAEAHGTACFRTGGSAPSSASGEVA